VLGYLATGQSELAARALNDQALEMLSDKVTNPFAAAAGGYVLLQQALRGDEPVKRWRGWIRNLADWFKDFPDGACLRRPLPLHKLGADNDTATPEECFRRAADLGAPLFAAGVGLLLDGMFACLRDDPRMAFVRRLATHVVRSEPFTTLRTDKESP